MIGFEDISIEYEKGIKVIEGFSTVIRTGENVGLIGANGAGKSTLMKAMLGLLPYSGRIVVDDIKVGPASTAEIRNKLGFILQNSDNQMFMPTVIEDLMFGPMNYGMSPEEAEKKADEVLEKLGLTDIKTRHNHKISVGEKRMAAIASVLTMEPEYLLMDEPTSALDPYNRRVVIDIINSLDKTCIIASHDLDMIMDTCQRVILLSKGKIVYDGDCEELMKNGALLKAHRMELPLRYQN
ncbi:MAG: energy-coupling factor ABC transporter ATP-binding protein [Lachnospiraceae bacterium]|nr:energy-coupling factor ABC transporter ATP-binding protein [Lachnospiraceae bacterium]